MNNLPNIREQLEACAAWLSYHHEDIAYGLKSAEDALKLWRYGQRHPELAEFCDQITGGNGDWTARHFKAAIGYNPFARAANLAERDE